MIPILMNGLEVQAEEHWTVLEAARFYGLEIPTLCWMEGLTPWGGCRLCLVEIGEPPKSDSSRPAPTPSKGAWPSAPTPGG